VDGARLRAQGWNRIARAPRRRRGSLLSAAVGQTGLHISIKASADKCGTIQALEIHNPALM
jgi:hypothetical protein